MDGIVQNAEKPADFYTQEYTSGGTYASRGYLESLSCPFYTQDVTDGQMQQIVDEAEAESLSRIADDMDKDYIEDIRFRQLENAAVRHNVPYYEDIVTAYHGTPNPNVQFSTEGSNVIYFTDNRTYAVDFARAEGRGGLLPGETPTLIHARITLRHPFVVSTDDEWEKIADATSLDKDELQSQGYDSILFRNESGVTAYVLFNQKDCRILQKETIKN